LSDGCNINRKTRPYKLFNGNGARFQFQGLNIGSCEGRTEIIRECVNRALRR
jgi:hypothetical protein